MSLFVGNISHGASPRDVEELFKRFGDCRVDVKRGFAFIDYDDDRDAEDALKDLQGKDLNGMRINVEWSKRHLARKGAPYPGRSDRRGDDRRGHGRSEYDRDRMYDRDARDRGRDFRDYDRYRDRDRDRDYGRGRHFDDDYGRDRGGDSYRDRGMGRDPDRFRGHDRPGRDWDSRDRRSDRDREYSRGAPRGRDGDLPLDGKYDRDGGRDDEFNGKRRNEHPDSPNQGPSIKRKVDGSPADHHRDLDAPAREEPAAANGNGFGQRDDRRRDYEDDRHNSDGDRDRVREDDSDHGRDGHRDRHGPRHSDREGDHRDYDDIDPRDARSRRDGHDDMNGGDRSVDDDHVQGADA